MQNEKEKHNETEEELNEIVNVIMSKQICFYWVVEENFKTSKFDKK